MEDRLEVDMDAGINEGSFGCWVKKSEKEVNKDSVHISVSSSEDHNAQVSSGIRVSLFDYSVENHFRAMDTISKLSGESEFECSHCEIKSLASSMTFLREWRYFCYQPRNVRFAYQSEPPQMKDVIGAINLPQFSSASVPQKDGAHGNKILSDLSKDYIMYVGGLVWALDWRPRVHQKPACDINLEFMAVAAHPPGSSYHKIGAPLTGRGVIQIWCLLNGGVKEQSLVPQTKEKLKQNCGSSGAVNLNNTPLKRPRGRPRKTPINECENILDGNNQDMTIHSVQLPEDSSKRSSAVEIVHDTPEQVAKDNFDRAQNAPCEGFSIMTEENHRISDSQNVKSSQPKKSRGRPRKMPIKESTNEDSLGTLAVATSEGVSAEHGQNPGSIETIDSKLRKPKKPREEPGKKPIIEAVNNLGSSGQNLQPLAVKFHKDSMRVLNIDGSSLHASLNVTKEHNSQQAQIPRDIDLINIESNQQQKPRGTCRKNSENESVNKLDCRNQYVQALSAQLPVNIIHTEGVLVKANEEVPRKDSSRKRKGKQEISENSVSEASLPRKVRATISEKDTFCATGLPLVTQNGETSIVDSLTSSSAAQDHMKLSKHKGNPGSFACNANKCFIPEDVALPRLVLCLAHNGKVAWDVKWQPFDCYPKSKLRMGYLAVVLGNGALEVWDVPLPHATKAVYSACQKEGTDPRFVKLEPVFRCSMLKCGDRQSIPLTVEWSTSSPHDLILAGCHDGVVALWKFSANFPCKDTRPLLCFSADTVPIRAVAWAPSGTDPGSANVIVTAGHKGLKFWDIRDPFRPLWDLTTVQRMMIYSLDWVSDPRCLVLSLDDGELRILSLSKAANDVPVTGRPFVGTQQQGLRSYYCSSSAIWSVQVSKLTGMVAYCCSDGTVIRFQLTAKAVENDPLRNRAPHYLCGSSTLDESDLTITSPLFDFPFQMKRSSNKWSDVPRSKRGFLSTFNQEKRAKEQMEKGQVSVEQPLALCHGNGPGSDDIPVTENSNRKLETKSSSKKKLKSDQAALICRDESIENMQGEEEGFKGKIGSKEEIEVRTPKIVAMHRVRWNMNKGSERWLCYGGAGGIVRCQEIN